MLSRRSFLAFPLFTPVFAQQKLKVVVTFTILADFVKRIGGEHVDVVSLVGFDEDAHHFHPKPNDLKQIVSADLFLSHGAGFDGWAKKFKAQEMSKDIDLVNNDPHIWHDLGFMGVYVHTIQKALSLKLPHLTAVFESNYKKTLDELYRLEKEASADFSALKSRKIVTNHDAFAYFGRVFNLEFIAPLGKLTGEVSAQALARVIAQIKKDNIKAIFIENVKSQRIMEQISRETGVKIGGRLLSDSLTKEQSDYFSFIRHNVKMIKEALS